MAHIQNEPGEISIENFSSRSAIRILALVEADTVNGPAKNLLNFHSTCQKIGAVETVQISLAPFVRLRRRLRNGAPSNEFLQAASKLGISSFCIRENFRFDPRVIGRLQKIVKQLDPDVIQTHYSKSHFLVWISGIWKTRPWIAFHHGHTRSVFRVRIYHGLDRWSLRVPYQIVTVSQAFAQQLAAKGVRSDRIAVLHNAVEPVSTSQESLSGDRAAKKACLGIAPTDQVVIAVGRLSKEKAFIDLIEAVSILHTLCPENRLRLMIVGEGTERRVIENYVRSAGLARFVKMPGHASNVNVYYEVADVLAISSTSEGSPNVLLEGMAAGVPIVATAVGGIPEIVNSGEHALLVPPHQPAAMAQAIQSLLSDRGRAERLARAARLLAAEKYSPEQRARSLVELYKNICHKWQLGRKR